MEFEAIFLWDRWLEGLTKDKQCISSYQEQARLVLNARRFPYSKIDSCGVILGQKHQDFISLG
jgi:hypothetical protein